MSVDLSTCIPRWVVSRRMSIRMPDGSMRSQKLPDARRVALGKRASFMISYQGHIYVFWLERARGGWRLADRGDSATSISKSK